MLSLKELGKRQVLYERLSYVAANGFLVAVFIIFAAGVVLAFFPEADLFVLCAVAFTGWPVLLGLAAVFDFLGRRYWHLKWKLYDEMLERGEKELEGL